MTSVFIVGTQSSVWHFWSRCCFFLYVSLMTCPSANSWSLRNLMTEVKKRRLFVVLSNYKFLLLAGRIFSVVCLLIRFHHRAFVWPIYISPSGYLVRRTRMQPTVSNRVLFVQSICWITALNYNDEPKKKHVVHGLQRFTGPC
jgi:hypothetical protein